MEFNRIGKIKNGKLYTWYVKLLDDTLNAGGYLLIQSPSKDFQGSGYDNWFLSIEEVEKSGFYRRVNGRRKLQPRLVGGLVEFESDAGAIKRDNFPRPRV